MQEQEGAGRNCHVDDEGAVFVDGRKVGYYREGGESQAEPQESAPEPMIVRLILERMKEPDGVIVVLRNDGGIKSYTVWNHIMEAVEQQIRQDERIRMRADV